MEEEKDKYKAGGSKAMGFAANPQNINRNGRPKDPIIQKFRDAIDDNITPDEWAKFLVEIVKSDDIDLDKKTRAIEMIAKYRAPGLAIPDNVDISDVSININLNE